MGVVGLCLALTSGCKSSTAEGGDLPHGGVTDGGVTDGGQPDAGQPDGGGDGGTQPYTSFEAFEQGATEAWCDLKARCGQFSDAHQCTSSVWELLAAHGGLPMTELALQRAVDDGRVHFDGAAAAACVVQLQASSCTGQLPPTDGPCTEALVGRVAETQGCFGDFECGATGYCAMGAECPGTCLRRKAEGEPASRAEECMPGHYVTTSGECTRFVPVGGACPSTGGGIGFGERPWCTPDAYCDEATDICRPRGALGADCGSSSQCTSMLTCTAGKCSPLTPTGGTCERYAPQACQADLQCTATDHAPTGTCEAKGVTGEACFQDDQCGTGLLCRDARGWEDPPVAGACSEPLAVGQACDVQRPYFCTDSAYCSSETSTCQPLLAVGEACTGYEACEVGAACSPEGLCAYVVCEDRTP
jgi:hypothetical protein